MFKNFEQERFLKKLTRVNNFPITLIDRCTELYELKFESKL